MTAITVRIGEPTAGRAPLHYGVNLEMADDAEAANLWDWLADSGTTMVRTFHPDRVFKRPGLDAGAPWAAVASRADYERFRAAWRTRPEQALAANGIDPSARMPWLGVPDALVAAMRRIGVMPLVSYGYRPKHYPKPLFHAPADRISDAVVNWDAAAAAYSCHLALTWHYAARHGVTHFNLPNEPELTLGDFHLPADCAWAKDFEELVATFHTDHEHRHAARRAACLGTANAQHRLLATTARHALEDLRPLLAERGPTPALRLAGPGCHFSEFFRDSVDGLVDIFDYHHYSRDPAEVRARHLRYADAAGEMRMSLGVAEYNLIAGNLRIDDSFFLHGNCLRLAEMIMTLLGSTRPDGPPREYLLLYLFSFPCTHRNYKSLIYGDMNLVDWSGADRPLWNRGSQWHPSEWHPTPAEAQLRHPTAAYEAFAMLARHVRYAGRPGGAPLCAVSLTGAVGEMPVALATAHDDCLVISLLNRGGAAVEGLRVEAPGPGWGSHVVRVLSRTQRDQVVAGGADDDAVTCRLEPESLTQVLFFRAPLQRATGLRLDERSTTPGGLAGLAPMQTTRLAGLARIDDRDAELGDATLVWSSEHPQVVGVNQRGLVQRLRPSHQATRIRAANLDGGLSAEVTVPPG